LSRPTGRTIPVTETRFTSAPVVSNPGAFLTDAMAQLRRSLPMVWPLFLSNLRARHRGLLLSYLWLLLPGIATAAICTYLQSARVLTGAATELPYPLHVLTGVFLWQLLADGVQAPLQQLKASRQLLTHSRVPHEAVILAGVVEAAVNCGARLLVLVPVLLLHRVAPDIAWLALPLALAALLALGVALGLLIAPWALLYDDASRATVLGLALWFVLTPIFYAAPSDGLLSHNPAGVLIETARSWLAGAPTGSAVALVAIGAGAALILGWLTYRIAKPHLLARLS
jgi:ABC-type polysaccharide/polyol phosphate export permease